MAQQIARILNGLVVNIEIADEGWGQQEAHEGATFVPFGNDQPAVIGYGWSPNTGFDQPEGIPFPPGFDPSVDPSTY